MPSNHTTIGAYNLEHKERYDIIVREKSGTLPFYIKSLGTFYRAIFSVRFVFHTTCYFCDNRTAINSGSGNCVGFGLRIETGTGKTTIVDIFDMVQAVRSTGIHLKVDEEQFRIARGSKTQANGYGPHVRNGNRKISTATNKKHTSRRANLLPTKLQP